MAMDPLNNCVGSDAGADELLVVTVGNHPTIELQTGSEQYCLDLREQVIGVEVSRDTLSTLSDATLLTLLWPLILILPLIGT